MTFVTLFGEIILGFLLADLLTGIVHWWMQRVAKETWPVIGSWAIRANREHHDDPLSFLSKGFVYRNYASAVIAGLVGLVWWLVIGLSVMLVITVITTALSNEIHRFTHEPHKAGPILKVMQEIGILQSPKGHSRHHRPPQNTNYCPITDWLNPILEAVGFWPRLEYLLRVR